MSDAHGAEALERGAPHLGEICIGDRNYVRALALQRIRAQSGGNPDFIVRVGGVAKGSIDEVDGTATEVGMRCS